MQLFPPQRWHELAAAHAERADTLTAAHRSRRAAGERHAIEDFLYTYYSTRPAILRRWHPGADVGLEPGPDAPAPQTAWRWYATDSDGLVWLDVDRFLTHRGEAVRFIRRLLSATASRQAFVGCFGLHEWAMVYRRSPDEVRHTSWPLRLGREGTDDVVETHRIRCSHFDAFRFFTPDAAPRTALQPQRSTQVDLEQPGCLHAAMDCHKWAMKLGPAVPGDLALDCFELARDVRLLDMRASPYDLSSYGWPAVKVETPQGKAEYVARQRSFAERAAALRVRLVAVCEAMLSRGSVVT